MIAESLLLDCSGYREELESMRGLLNRMIAKEVAENPKCERGRACRPGLFCCQSVALSTLTDATELRFRPKQRGLDRFGEFSPEIEGNCHATAAASTKNRSLLMAAIWTGMWLL